MRWALDFAVSSTAQKIKYKGNIKLPSMLHSVTITINLVLTTNGNTMKDASVILS